MLTSLREVFERPIRRPGAPAASYPSSRGRAGEGGTAEGCLSRPGRVLASEAVAGKSGGNVLGQKTGMWGEEIRWMLFLPNLPFSAGAVPPPALQPLSSRPQFPHTSHSVAGPRSRSPGDCFHQNDIQIPRRLLYGAGLFTWKRNSLWLTRATWGRIGNTWEAHRIQRNSEDPRLGEVRTPGSART